MDLSELLQQLPEDLIVHSIFPLMDSTSRARAAAVCRSWRNFSRRAPPPARDAYGSIPWMVLTDKKLKHSLLQPPMSFSQTTPHRPSSYKLKIKKEDYIPHCENGEFIVASHRQSVMTNEQHCETGVIHNLFSGEEFELSPASCCWPLASFSYLSNLPEPNLVAVMEDCQGHTLIHRSWMDGEKWKVAFHEGFVPDLIFHKEQLFCVTERRAIKAMYLSSPNLPWEWPDPYESKPQRLVLDSVRTVVPRIVGRRTKNPGAKVKYYLVESCNGVKLWLVTQHKPGDRTTKFEVHEVLEGGLVEVADLGEAMLFLKAGSSVSCFSALRTLSSPVLSDEFFTKNSIYFFHTEKGSNGSKFRLGKFILGDKSAKFHPVPIYSERPPYWINPVVKV